MMIWRSLDPKVLASILVHVAEFFERKAGRNQEPLSTSFRNWARVEQASQRPQTGNYT